MPEFPPTVSLRMTGSTRSCRSICATSMVRRIPGTHGKSWHSARGLSTAWARLNDVELQRVRVMMSGETAPRLMHEVGRFAHHVMDQLGIGIQMELFEDPSAIGADRLMAEAQQLSDFLVLSSFADQSQDLLLAG